MVAYTFNATDIRTKNKNNTKKYKNEIIFVQIITGGKTNEKGTFLPELSALESFLFAIVECIYLIFSN